MTTLRLAMKAVEEGLRTIEREGSQASVLDRMQHRKELYELVAYDRYTELDQQVGNYKA